MITVRVFYTTKNKGLAGEWAVLGTGRDGYINEYTLDMTGLKVLQLDKLPIENWIAILIANRRGTYKEEIVVSRIERFKDMFFPDVSSFDVIVGWRADDAYFSFVEDFMLSAITIENLQKAMKFGDLGQQVCCVSSMAFERLQFQNSYKAHVSRFYNGAVNRDETARKEYFRLARSKDASKGRLIFDIIGR